MGYWVSSFGLRFRPFYLLGVSPVRLGMGSTQQGVSLCCASTFTKSWRCFSYPTPSLSSFLCAPPPGSSSQLLMLLWPLFFAFPFCLSFSWASILFWAFSFFFPFLLYDFLSHCSSHLSLLSHPLSSSSFLSFLVSPHHLLVPCCLLSPPHHSICSASWRGWHLVLLLAILWLLCSTISSNTHSFSAAPPLLLTPCYKKSILGSKQPVSGNLFFCRFSLRLSENNRSRVKFMAKFGPTASNFGYIIFPIFG